MPCMSFARCALRRSASRVCTYALNSGRSTYRLRIAWTIFGVLEAAPAASFDGGAAEGPGAAAPGAEGAAAAARFARRRRVPRDGGGGEDC